MIQRVESQREFWLDHARTDQGRAYIEAKCDGLVERWVSDEPMHLFGWELPRWAAGGIRPAARVVVHGDGRVEPVDSGGPGGAPVVDLASRRQLPR